MLEMDKDKKKPLTPEQKAWIEAKFSAKENAEKYTKNRERKLFWTAFGSGLCYEFLDQFGWLPTLVLISAVVFWLSFFFYVGYTLIPRTFAEDWSQFGRPPFAAAIEILLREGKLLDCIILLWGTALIVLFIRFLIS